uniref:Uncharacterized protein n=1 Tax=Parastrongyloides trichosuri TaxID=131310 RepID=A0A0N4ZJ15_PARTI
MSATNINRILSTEEIPSLKNDLEFQAMMRENIELSSFIKEHVINIAEDYVLQFMAPPNFSLREIFMKAFSEHEELFKKEGCNESSTTLVLGKHSDDYAVKLNRWVFLRECNFEDIIFKFASLHLLTRKIPIGREYGVFIHYLYAFSGIPPFVGVKKRFKSYYEKARILGNPGYLKHYATNDGFDDERQFNEVRDGTQQHENKEAYEPTQNSDNEVNESQQNNGENEICNEPSIIPTRSMDESQQNSDEDEILNELSTIPTRSLDESLSLFIN